MVEHRRRHGAMYAALNHNPIGTARPGRLLAALLQLKAAEGRLVPAVNVTNWLRPDTPPKIKLSRMFLGSETRH
ncbi:hypothetical protein QF037_009205 [Streptomyces canus]|uniref:hypothetical protein n=1 Tax=Streptomyces canus TaxID=58343 RepID=UPI0027865AA8|nr:hypothetical protein [Streptomyces canus]MDQ0604860.1 hypothetical protein [Streptomyces canus]